jgi:NAD(P)-dependent dehydrogenase (short-subunit alcohol dehydrogenase family)
MSSRTKSFSVAWQVDVIGQYRGGNSGIGLATARRFVKEGTYLFITARRQAELDAAVLLIAKNVTAIRGDVSDLNDLDRLYEVVRKVKGRVDIVFANAGVVDPVSLPESTLETFDKRFNLNARGGVLYGAEGTPAARRQSINHPLRVGRMADGRTGFRRVFGNESGFGLLRPNLDELAGRGIRGNVIGPGPTETPMVHVGANGSEEGTSDYLRKMIPMGRLGTPDEIASAAVFLASDESSFITGIDLLVDGGTASR